LTKILTPSSDLAYLIFTDFLFEHSECNDD
jgi:hypothetical protein